MFLCIFSSDAFLEIYCWCLFPSMICEAQLVVNMVQEFVTCCLLPVIAAKFEWPVISFSFCLEFLSFRFFILRFLFFLLGSFFWVIYVGLLIVGSFSISRIISFICWFLPSFFVHDLGLLFFPSLVLTFI